MSALWLGVVLLTALAPDTQARLEKAAAESVAAADAAILSEEVVGGYRVGLVVDDPGRFWARGSAGSLEEIEMAKTTHLIGVILREETTKRFLPGAQVRVELGSSGEIGLSERVGTQYPIYATNTTLASGSETRLVVHVTPHLLDTPGDVRLAGHAPVDVEVTVRIAADGTPSVAGAKAVTGLSEGYEPGDDLRLALEKAHDAQAAGEYIVALITEPPKKSGTHHLGVALFSSQTGLPITGANVRLKLKPTSDDLYGSILSLHPLWDELYYYGLDTTVLAGEYEVSAVVQPPPTGSLGEPWFDDGVEVAFTWSSDAQPIETASGSTPVNGTAPLGWLTVTNAVIGVGILVVFLVLWQLRRKRRQS